MNIENQKLPLLLQVCIPFCVRQCAYCRFPFCAYDPRTVNAYTQALLREIEAWEDELEDHEVQAVSIEGGCPALLGPDALFHVIRKLRSVFRFAPETQICLQTMPGDYSRALMEKMRDAGVNFWIVGLQTARRDEHDLLLRPYKFDAITMADMAIRTFEPHALSFELLAGIPGQTESSLLNSLERCLYYAPEHMTIYPLRLPEGKALAERAPEGSGRKAFPQPQTDRLLAFAKDWLFERGFEAYTPYDYARPGFRCRYRELTRQGCERLGLGYHSSSWLDGVSWQTGHSLQEYLEHPDDFTITTAAVAKAQESPLSCETFLF